MQWEQKMKVRKKFSLVSFTPLSPLPWPELGIFAMFFSNQKFPFLTSLCCRGRDGEHQLLTRWRTIKEFAFDGLPLGKLQCFRCGRSYKMEVEGWKCSMKLWWSLQSHPLSKNSCGSEDAGQQSSSFTQKPVPFLEQIDFSLISQWPA